MFDFSLQAAALTAGVIRPRGTLYTASDGAIAVE